MLLSCLGAPARRSIGPLLIAGFGLLAAGCASSSQTQTRTYAQVAATIDRSGKVVIEDDGLPAQLPPPRRATNEADDPREPYSPNYGSNVPKVSFGPGDSLPLVRSAQRVDPDAVIAQAILAHEQRYR